MIFIIAEPAPAPGPSVMQNLYYSRSSHNHSVAPVLETSVGTTTVLAPATGNETHIASLTNVGDSNLKVVSTEAGSAVVDKLVNDGTTTFTAEKDDEDLSATVAVIVDKTTNEPVAKIETSVTDLLKEDPEPATPDHPKVVAILDNVDASNLKVISTTDQPDVSDDGNLAVITDGNSDMPVDNGTEIHYNDPVAIVDDGTGLHIGRLTTDGVLNVQNNLESGNTYIGDLTTTEASVVNFGQLVMLI